MVTKQNIPLLPCLFAFGGGMKPLSELVFNKYDTDKNGLISPEEFRRLCVDFGQKLSDVEFDWAWNVMDKDGSGMVDYQEFAQWWNTSSRFDHLKMPNGEQEYNLNRILQLFRWYDENKTGALNQIQFNALREALMQDRILDMSKHQALHFDEIDLNHDEKININELIASLKNIGMLNS